VTGQYASVDDGLTGTNNLVMIGRLLGLSRATARARARELLARFDLTDAAARPVKTYSGGMRRRIDLAASLVGRPDVLFLDEPTTGLDPQARSDVWDMIRALVADGVTVLLTTQYLDEADQLAHDIAVIDRGHVIATGTPDELKAKVGSQVLEVEPADPARMTDVAAVLARWTGSLPAIGARQVSAQVPGAAVVPRIVRELDEVGIELAAFSMRKSSLDEVFLMLTGHRAEEDRHAEAGAAQVLANAADGRRAR
jgi:oleandomycin transport system ATP-binding protein